MVWILLKFSVLVPKPFDIGTTRRISCSGHLVPLFGFGPLAPSFEMDFNRYRGGGGGGGGGYFLLA